MRFARRWARRLALWALDYLVISAWQVRGVLRPEDPERYARPTPCLGAPVLLVPGIYEQWGVLRTLARDLHDQGHPVHAVPSLGYNHGPVAEMAERAARVLVEQDLHGVVLVAHSKGGLIGKRLMLDPAVAGRIAGMVAVNAPFTGSPYAAWLPVRSVRALAPRHPSVLALAAEREINTRITSIYPTFDPHVPSGSDLPGGRNIEIPTTGHFRTLVHPAVRRAVLAEVRRAAQGGAAA